MCVIDTIKVWQGYFDTQYYDWKATKGIFCGTNNAILLNFNINLSNLVDICVYELSTNGQNFRQKDTLWVEISLKMLGGGYFFWLAL